LLGKEKKNSLDNSSDSKYSVAIFRLAPQDYHRVHCPLNGKIIKITHIHGAYYTVNPMAVRSSLDVFGENIRTIVTLETAEYGIVEVVLVGAMMVGSIIITAKLNEEIKKGQEVGYFKFGGSTVVLVFQSENDESKIEWDGDLVSNSNKKLETLVKVGMSVGHSINVEGYKRGFKKEVTDTERQEIIRRVTGLGDGYGVGISVGDNIKAKLGGMFDDVMSLKSKKSFTGGSGDNEGKGSKIDEIISNDWEIQELTTLDGINDYEYENDDDNDDENDVDIQLAVPLPSHEIYQSVNGVHDLNSVDYEEGSSH
jgi:phosphatidylserine decarboxylase